MILKDDGFHSVEIIMGELFRGPKKSTSFWDRGKPRIFSATPRIQASYLQNSSRMYTAKLNSFLLSQTLFWYFPTFWNGDIW